MTYDIQELTIRNNSVEEQKRTRLIFEDLKTKAINNEYLSEYEKNFLYTSMRISYLNDGNPDDIPKLDNSKFKFLYLVYFDDITGGKQYQKPVKKRLEVVNPEEARNDLDYLISKAKEWENIIMKTNHSEKLLQVTSKEARDDIKALNEHPEFANNPFSKGTFRFKYKKWGILLRNKFIYHITQEILETKEANYSKLYFCGNEIIINQYSYIHIVNRHFAEITTPYHTGKTFHTEDFYPRQLDLNLQKIFDNISDLAIKPNQIENIVFDYKGILYSIWTGFKSEGIKGKGMITFRMVKTFYPVKKNKEEQRIKQKFKRIEITPQIGYWK